MKIIFRADDLGFSEAVNYGIRKAIVDGVITCTGLMPNMPYAAAGYALVKDTDVEVGQHSQYLRGTAADRPGPYSLPGTAQRRILYQPRNTRPKTGYYRSGGSGTGDPGAARPLPRHHRAGSAYFEGHAVMSPNFFQGVEECGCP